LILHGADHHEAQACFEPALDGVAGLRRIYPDLPGMGQTFARETLRSADDVLDTRLNFADEVAGATAHLHIGHSAGAYYTQDVAPASALVDHYPHASLAVVDDAGHALPHEQPQLLRALLVEWLARVERSS
jgi:pimeloyl-ACP methyl ester carboxylesterase